MMPIQCIDCKNYEGKSICKAFPKGIPAEIMTGEVIHDKIHPKQKNDIIFEELKE